MVFVLFVPLQPDARGDELKKGVGFRLGFHDFSDPDLADYYDFGSLLALDFIIPSRPTVSYRISLEMIGATGEYSESYYVSGYGYVTGYASGVLDMTGFSAAIMAHTAQQEKFGAYAGIGLGFYSVTEDVTASASAGGTTVTISDTADGGGMGSNLFGGLNIALSPQVSLGLELNILLLTASMSSSLVGSFESDYGGIGQSLVLNARF